MKQGVKTDLTGRMHEGNHQELLEGPPSVAPVRGQQRCSNRTSLTSGVGWEEVHEAAALSSYLGIQWAFSL